MSRHSLTAALAVSLLAGLGCSPASGLDGSGIESPTPDARTPDAPEGCTSTFDAGLVCTRCGDSAAPECLAAACVVIEGGCLQCTDPLGNVASDCTLDYTRLRSASATLPPGDTWSLATCTFAYGVPTGSGTTCYFPGTSSCTTTGDQDWHCLSCELEGGGGTGTCMDGSEPLPDPMIGRPGDLPAPGTCVTQIGDDKHVCTTCTHEDLSATSSCHYPGIVFCDLFPVFDDSTDGCLGSCTLIDGSEVRMCNSTRGPRPVARPTP